MDRRTFCPKGHNKDITGRRGSTCKVCHNDHKKEWMRKNPKKYRDAQRNSHWRTHGFINADGSAFTQIDYDRAYQVQAGKCLGCGRHQTELKSILHADHDHKTGIFRRLLCGGCNRVIGITGESPELLRKLALMLEHQ